MDQKNSDMTTTENLREGEGGERVRWFANTRRAGNYELRIDLCELSDDWGNTDMIFRYYQNVENTSDML